MNPVRPIAIAFFFFIAEAGGPARAEPSAEDLLKLHTEEAESYRIYRDQARTKALELRKQPIFSWTNLAGESTQYGHLFVWTDAGRPEAIGTIFSARAALAPQQRMLVHEFHTLSTDKLYPVTPTTSAYQWEPQRGVALTICEDAPPVAQTPAQRLLQMRALARTFSAESRNREGQTWELRLLPTPLFQYQPSTGQVLHGALFALVSSAGTDPEVLLLIEARRPTPGTTPGPGIPRRCDSPTAT
jgi:hypothetical protein